MRAEWIVYTLMLIFSLVSVHRGDYNLANYFILLSIAYTVAFRGIENE